jgi:hypothetical protein
MTLNAAGPPTSTPRPPSTPSSCERRFERREFTADDVVYTCHICSIQTLAQIGLPASGAEDYRQAT